LHFPDPGSNGIPCTAMPSSFALKLSHELGDSQ